MCDSAMLDRNSEEGRTNPFSVTHDVEMTYETSEEALEADLHQHCNNCNKNPGHHDFIPMNDFSLIHLPDACKHADVLKMVKTQGELTARIRVSHTSASRPNTFPETDKGVYFPYYEPGEVYPFKDWVGSDWSRVGTGAVSWITRGGEWRDIGEDKWRTVTELQGLCPCRPKCPAKNWAKLGLLTALHVVYDQKEAEHSEMEFFFNTDQDRRKKNTRKIRSGVVTETEIEGDRCEMVCHTHDPLLISRLETANKIQRELRAALYNFVPPSDFCPAFLVSHPHGCGKMVTVGDVKEQKGAWFAPVSLFSTASCPGSSGAPVLWWSKNELLGGRPVLVAMPSPHSGFVTVGGRKLGRCGVWVF